MAGFIISSFNSTSADFKLTLSVPANSKARVCLPALGLTSATLEIDGKSVEGTMDRDYVCVADVGSAAKPHVIERKGAGLAESYPRRVLNS
jgi:hypothetical protein